METEPPYLLLVVKLLQRKEDNPCFSKGKGISVINYQLCHRNCGFFEHSKMAGLSTTVGKKISSGDPKIEE